VHREILRAHKRMDSLVHEGKQYACMRNFFCVYDAIMVAGIVVITCSEWFTCTIILCA
jgi:hypothetical protein